MNMLMLKRHLSAGADQALDHADYSGAARKLARASSAAAALADLTSGRLRDQYVNESRMLIGVAERLQGIEMREGRETGQAKDEGAQPGRQTVKLDDIVGLDYAKEVVRSRFINYMRYRRVFEELGLTGGGGMLMFGPPGCGKTQLARGVAGEAGAPFLHYDAASLKSKYVGVAEKHMRSVFREAARHPTATIFIDEIHQVLGGSGNSRSGLRDTFLTEMDGFTKRNNTILFIGATNAPWRLAPEVLRPGRLGTIVYVGLPRREERRKMFAEQMRDASIEPDVDISGLADQTRGHTNAEIKAIVDLAKLSAANRVIRGIEANAAHKAVILAQDLTDAITRVKPRVTREDLKRYADWARQNAENQPGIVEFEVEN